ncbi:OsmC family protein [Mycoplasma sp. E35C]|uniref:OsmC family protein n=1 Tax=Mycoplasma sp. E35C TaxID=2801918 RepID=UPI001CA41827|nr:OsmC family protein [Mycoplasma sp. E35C]QZX48969.1 OsmC family protein [Mycoplasma sp. E35C]
MAIKNYEIKAKLNADKTITASSGQHSFVLDASTVKGMSPLAATLNSLCGCEMSIINYFGPKMYGLELQELEMEVKAWRDSEPADEYYGARKIQIHWKVKSNKSLEEFKEIVKYAHKTCPVYNSLSGRIIFEDTFSSL